MTTKKEDLMQKKKMTQADSTGPGGLLGSSSIRADSQTQKQKHGQEK